MRLSAPLVALLAAPTAVLLLIGMTEPARAATCAAQPVTARGDPSRFEVLAKAKARGNWRAKVRAIPSLGAPYADWNKAAGADYRCIEEDGRFQCTAVARPCRD
jgi:hypothetical protein